MTQGPDHVAFLMPSAGWGGIERKTVNFANELAGRGIRTDILLSRTEIPPYAKHLHADVGLQPLGARHKHTAVPKVRAYLNAEQPDALITAKDHGHKVGIIAGSLAATDTSVVLAIGNTLRVSERRWSRRLGIRLLYRLADGIVANSRGVAHDLVASFGLPAERVHTVYNPVVTWDLGRACRGPVDHPWLQPGRSFPTLVACGRLSPQKDFANLLRAVASVRGERDCRLIILGEGPRRSELEHMAQELGVANAVDMVGFVPDSHAWMAKADTFVLSSLWEGLPNVLIEAMACGTPCVATDCPSGPREILQEGKYGELVGVGDWQQLARGITTSLEVWPGSADLEEAVNPFRAERATDQLLEALKRIRHP